ncbi:hypothetical protein AVDCRST_MAG94-118 [uncultured Leptolyngbya sp.]|uniref:Uncharacterized protein n=1 Tax=uncultured Leptolyngbya sp. TaxID=332963 RepID=A0A6J4K855_9CYAN|nr:hypothetical protein AVDCRST_MAG94-118 [uncultured Leptolyngbya sp.]
MMSVSHDRHGRTWLVRAKFLKPKTLVQPPPVVTQAIWQRGGFDAGGYAGLAHGKRVPGRIADFVQRARRNSGKNCAWGVQLWVRRPGDKRWLDASIRRHAL